LTTINLAGAVGSPATGGLWTFVGATGQLTVTLSQRVTGSGVAVLGTTSTSATTVNFGLCYQQSGGLVTAFQGNNYLTASITASTGKIPFAAAGSIMSFAVGTVTVGFCLYNVTGLLDNNDFMNAYFQVSN
jgi:hypothetical protein